MSEHAWEITVAVTAGFLAGVIVGYLVAILGSGLVKGAGQ